MSKHPLQVICELNDNLKARSYSGRGMFGKSCLGVELDRGVSVGKLFATVLETLFGEGASRAEDFSEDGEDVEREEIALQIAEAFRDMCQDQMGTGAIVYFPNIEYVDEEEEEDDEDEDEEEDEDHE